MVRYCRRCGRAVGVDVYRDVAFFRDLDNDTEITQCPGCGGRLMKQELTPVPPVQEAERCSE